MITSIVPHATTMLMPGNMSPSHQFLRPAQSHCIAPAAFTCTHRTSRATPPPQSGAEPLLKLVVCTDNPDTASTLGPAQEGHQ